MIALSHRLELRFAHQEGQIRHALRERHVFLDHLRQMTFIKVARSFAAQEKFQSYRISLSDAVCIPLEALLKHGLQLSRVVQSVLMKL